MKINIFQSLGGKALLPFYLFTFLLFSSCDSYVDIIPKGNTIPETVDDMAKLMANGSLAQGGKTMNFTDVNYNIAFFDIYSDDYNAPQDPQNAYYNVVKSKNSLVNEVTWADYIYGAAETDPNWDGLYKSNYVVNYVLDHIDNATEGVANKREDVKGQALVHRAMNYFLLTCLYGKQYNDKTSTTDLSVPLILHADVNNQLPRATVKEVYDQIMSDLNEAVKIMTVEVPKYNNIPGLATAYALRARVNLWMQNYDGAYEDAVKSLSMRNTLIDYNTLSQVMPGTPAYGISGYDTNPQTNPEILYERYCSESLEIPFSEKMMKIIDQKNDLRWTTFMGALPFASITETCLWTRKHHSGIDISEVWLTRAEAALRKSSPNVADAKESLETLRKSRYAAATYKPFEASTNAELLDEILKERRREIIYTEMSFIDHKRQNADPSTARPMERNVWGKEYSMPVDDPHWQLAIPLNIMQMNNQLIQNER